MTESPEMWEQIGRGTSGSIVDGSFSPTIHLTPTHLLWWASQWLIYLQEPALSAPASCRVKLTLKASGLLRKDLWASPRRLCLKPRAGPEERPLLPHSPRWREGPSFRPISKSSFSSSLLLSPAARDRRARPALPPAHSRTPKRRRHHCQLNRWFFQSNPPLGHQLALAEPMPTLFLPLLWGSAANHTVSVSIMGNILSAQ